MKEEKEGVKAAEQEKPKKRRNRKKNRKNEMRKSYFAGMISMLAIVMIVLVGTTFLWPGSRHNYRNQQLKNHHLNNTYRLKCYYR